MKYLSIVALLLIAGMTCGCIPVHQSSSPTTITTSTSGNHVASLSLNQSIVEVWIPDPAEQISLGVVVGDGTMVLTIVNYEDYNPGQVKVVSAGNEFTATVQAIDSRTGATLLKMGKGKLPDAPTGDATKLMAGDKLLVWGQEDSDSVLSSTEVLVTDVAPHSILDFNVVLPEDVMNSGGYNGSQSQGAVVTDLSGKVLGLESVYTTRLVMRLGPIGYIPPIISINSAMELLSPAAAGQPWSNGPFLFSANEGSKSGFYDGLMREYVSVATAITLVLSELGQPLSISDLPPDFTSYVWSNMGTYTPDGSLLTTVFPRPVELRDLTGNVLAQAKWVAIQWGRDEGKPSRIVYGSVAYVVEGSFEITGDISGLDSAVLTMVNDQMPYGP